MKELLAIVGRIEQCSGNDAMKELSALRRRLTLRRKQVGILENCHETCKELSAGRWQHLMGDLETRYPGFIDRLGRIRPTLTQWQRKICTMSRLDMSNAEIAQVLGTGTKNVYNHTNRLCKQFGLAGGRGSLRRFLETV
jgi:DNA-binding NarL/FixJ family response regulator